MGKGPRLQLEAGKYYRTRDGRKAYVAGSSPFRNTAPEHQWVGFLDEISNSWASNGVFLPGHGSHDNDLVAEWPEPIIRWTVFRDNQLLTGIFEDEARAKDKVERDGYGRVVKLVEAEE